MSLFFTLWWKVDMVTTLALVTVYINTKYQQFINTNNKLVNQQSNIVLLLYNYVTCYFIFYIT